MAFLSLDRIGPIMILGSEMCFTKWDIVRAEVTCGFAIPLVCRWSYAQGMSFAGSSRGSVNL